MSNQQYANTVREAFDAKLANDCGICHYDFYYPSATDKRSFMLWCYGGKFVTPWVNSIRNQIDIDNLMPSWKISEHVDRRGRVYVTTSEDQTDYEFDTARS